MNSLLGFHADICIFALSWVFLENVEALTRIDYLLGSDTVVSFTSDILSVSPQSSTGLTFFMIAQLSVGMLQHVDGVAQESQSFRLMAFSVWSRTAG